jgi:hypothetical protein
MSKDKVNMFTYMIFRQAKAACDASKNYVFLSGTTNSIYTGVYELSTTNVYSLYHI